MNGGEWRSATFEASLGDLASLERLTWTVALDPSAFGAGDHEVEVRALTEDGFSLSSFATFTGSAAQSGAAGGASLMTVAFVLFAMALAAVVVVKSRADTPLRLSEEADAKSNNPPAPSKTTRRLRPPPDPHVLKSESGVGGACGRTPNVPGPSSPLAFAKCSIWPERTPFPLV